ncbi:MAG: histidinol phosphate phosphatase domain-containing protein [Syntrophales bacterium]|nr:histidinol phosphate phosphatase domain-containing protein [Syntrophales bacterium]MDD5232731.1 histidinol phosphate phosphatase domain-containing protein [Syntrophales bacterium]MDD5531581.1 histidinol phosphate phosphatase domain-containing protein [Syntrophales bacterium]HPL63173.1 histidinol phosphate phosphatase domain-containing protein [Syntrophales bacterium]
MIDLHTHSIFSDGELIPAELVRRAVDRGCRGIAITDHADHSNIDFIIPRICRICEKLTRTGPIKVVPGIELTHTPPSLIPELVREARSLGARIVVMHGETISEPVAPGTNISAIESRVDILAHPGLITREEAALAAKNSVFLEISGRKGHSLTNGHVASLALGTGAGLVLNTDSHSPSDLVDRRTAERIAAGAGIPAEEINNLFRNSERLLEKALRP